MADNSTQGDLPDYERPPVIETVLGVQFERLALLKNAHLGAFWKSLDTDEWSTVTESTLIPPQFEQFEEEGQWIRGVQFQHTQDPACRLRIANANGDRTIQVQNTRLHFNWLGKGDHEYPRYARMRDGFQLAYEYFCRFLTTEGIGDVLPNQWEITYINHIPRGTVWETPSDWDFFRPLAGMETVEGVIQGESFGGEWHFVIPPERGRLHIEWQHGKGSPDEFANSHDFIRLTLTARGALDSGGDLEQPILDGLDLGHETIVRSFRNLMSNSANEYWGLK